jgi:pimeloyl-ACP methyl ester carboxylesterase
MWKWIPRSALSAVGPLALALGAGLVYDQWSRWNMVRVYSPPGDLVEFDGARSHLHCIGEGSPTVLLEAGLDPSGSYSWRRVLPGIVATTRVCAYDRAGILWSEPRPGPRDAHRIADELHALLAAASEPPPYVMVGHSFGGLLVRVFDRRFKGELVGFVLVDSAHPTQLYRMPLGAIASEKAPLGRRLVAKFLAATGITRLTAAPPKDPPEAYARSSMLAAQAEVQAFRESCAQAAETGKLDNRPLVVLTAGHVPPPQGMSGRTQNVFRDIRLALQTELVMLSANADHRVSPRAGHFVQLDDPAAVITAIRDVVTAVRAGTRVRKAAPDPNDGASLARLDDALKFRRHAATPHTGAALRVAFDEHERIAVHRASLHASRGVTSRAHLGHHVSPRPETSGTSSLTAPPPLRAAAARGQSQEAP